MLGPPVPALQPQRRVTELPSAQVKDPQINNAGALDLAAKRIRRQTPLTHDAMGWASGASLRSLCAEHPVHVEQVVYRPLVTSVVSVVGSYYRAVGVDEKVGG